MKEFKQSSFAPQGRISLTKHRNPAIETSVSLDIITKDIDGINRQILEMKRTNKRTEDRISCMVASLHHHLNDG